MATFPLTHAQMGIWNIEKIYPFTSIGNIAGTLKIKDKVDFDILERAINLLIEKNDCLRLRFIEEDGEPRQYVSEYKFKKIDYLDFSTRPIEELYAWDEQQTRMPFNLIDSELCYFAMIKINENEAGFYSKTHHLISDAWTMTILGSRIIKYYWQLKNNFLNMDVEPSYIEHVSSEKEYLKSKRFENDSEYWTNKFECLPELTVLKTRSSNEISTKTKRKSFVLPIKLSVKLREYCRNNKVSVFAVFLAALLIYINRVTQKDDIILGTPILNRSNTKEKETMGMFISTVPVRFKIDELDNFSELVKYVTKELMSMLRHQKYPYSMLQQEIHKKYKMSERLFDILISYQNAIVDIDEEGLQHESRWHFCGHQTESLGIHINDRDNNGNLVFNYDFLSDLFYAKEVEFIHDHVIRLLWHGLDNPMKEISRLEMASEKEKFRILFEFINTDSAYPSEKTIHQIFEERATSIPDKVALIFEGRELTYRELNSKANKIARTLRNKGIKPDTLVSIMVNRSFEMIIGILGILKAGGGYLPISPDYPEDRVNFILKDSGAKILLTENQYLKTVPEDVDFIFISEMANQNIEDSNLNNINTPRDLAYVMYTSGSTGVPKGVMIEHLSVINTLTYHQNRYPLGENDAYLLKTAYTFDVSVIEVFWFFGNGKLVILPEGFERQPDRILKYIDAYFITHINFVPSMFNAFLSLLDNEEKNILNKLKYILLCGEAVSSSLVEKYQRLNTRARLENLYGPTEATIYVTDYSLDNNQNGHTIPIGKPINNTQLYILNKNNQIQPIGIAGELCIGGTGLARGYLNRPELTSEKFVSNPYGDGYIYKTGDLAKWKRDGDIEFLGRIDNQVKIRGYRIELGEVEKQILSYPDIKDVVVIARTGSMTEGILIAYFVAETKISSSEINEYLSKKMPYFMIPSNFVQIDKIPSTHNGKVDRKALPDPKANQLEQTNFALPENEVEEKLEKIWAEILDVDKVNVNANLFDFGVDSLMIMRAQSIYLKEGFKFSTQDFYSNKSIREHSDTLMKKRGNSICIDANINEIFVDDLNNSFADHKKLCKTDINTILLTGVTGFLGIHILDELLWTTQADIYCIVRSKTVQQAQERLIKLLNFYFPEKYNESIWERVFVLNGDISKDKLGIEQKKYFMLGKRVEQVIHSAAIVKHYGHYDEFERVNVNGTRNVIDFCKATGIKLNYVSTISVSGDGVVEQSRICPKFTENDFFIGQKYFEHAYVRSKFEAENLVLKCIKQGLKAKIFRVGFLAERYTDGKFQINPDENIFHNTLGALLRCGSIPGNILEQYIEMTPVDYCTKALIKLIQLEDTDCRIFHLYNNNRIKISELISLLGEGLGINVEVLERCSFEDFIEYLYGKACNEQDINFLSCYFNFEKMFNRKTQVGISCDITLQYLKHFNIAWPEIDSGYLQKVIGNLNLMAAIKY